MASTAERPAFYALRPGGWRDLVTLLHPPYTAWHLSYVAIGAAAAPHLFAVRLVATLGAFFLAVGISAHALDELHGRPLGTRLSDRTLWTLAAGGLGGALVLGGIGAVTVSPLLVVFMVVGSFTVVAYNLEVFGGALHNTTGFALAWGGLPAITSYWINAGALHAGGLVVALACVGLSVAQRRLSAPARELRRRTVAVSGSLRLIDGQSVELSREQLAAPLEGALRALASALVLLAAGLLLARV
ncbi:MAG: hypothetical protein QOK25_405 [Thermoleophilaceae bacterium]|jgi:hypothetical protein|nr:hypothetical protein [Thermoleophilaceae bacterium]